MKIDERYLDLDYNGLHIQVKMEDEGIILDVFEDGENVATTHKLYEDFNVNVKCKVEWLMKIIRKQISITKDELEILEDWEELPSSSFEDAIVNGIVRQIKGIKEND